MCNQGYACNFWEPLEENISTLPGKGMYFYGFSLFYVKLHKNEILQWKHGQHNPHLNQIYDLLEWFKYFDVSIIDFVLF